ncbi:MAG TPA: hypothetical protein VHX65_00215 [Pirellulales bacterium]|jgi:hypothetical protein|nr:hypothetical protein [Pirellulales bacterium]
MAIFLHAPRMLSADPPATPVQSAPQPTIVSPTLTAPAGPTVEESLSSIIQQLIVDSLPRQFTDERKWGKTARAVNGFSIKTDGDGIKIRKHTHEVNDGLWKEYRAELVDPKKELQIRVQNVRTTAMDQTSLQLFLAARLHGEARLEQWKNGVKLFDVSAEADCKIEARIDMNVRLIMKQGTLLGDVAVEPKVTGADLKLVDFELQKVSKLQGWAAHQLGEGLKPEIARQLHREEPKLVEKLNAAIEKKKGRLRFSPDAAVSNGFSKLESLLHLDDAP